MRGSQDPRLVELKRLRSALDTAIKQLDEFDARLSKSVQMTWARLASTQSAMPAENGFAVKIAAGLAKFREITEDQTPSPSSHKLGSFRKKANQ